MTTNASTTSAACTCGYLTTNISATRARSSSGSGGCHSYARPADRSSVPARRTTSDSSSAYDPIDTLIDSCEVRSSLNANERAPVAPALDATSVDVLVVCTANQCRSPMAAAIIRGEFERRGVSAHVHSGEVSALADIGATRDAIS